MTVVVGYVQRPESEHALEVAIEEARRRGVALHIVHYLGHEPGDSPEQARREAHISEDVEHHLAAVADRIRAIGVDATAELRHGLHGRAGRALLDAAAEADAELIVVGVEPRSRVEKLLLGSVAREVLLGAPCPVLTVKAPEPA